MAEALCDNFPMNQHFTALLRAIGENPQREGLRDTPDRAARALKFLTQGYKQKLEDIVNDAQQIVSAALK